jgi:hypothetical protein
MEEGSRRVGQDTSVGGDNMTHIEAARKRSTRKIKHQAKRNIQTVIRAAKPLLPEDAEPHYIIALANEMLQQASTVYEPDWRSNGPDQQPQDE